MEIGTTSELKSSGKSASFADFGTNCPDKRGEAGVEPGLELGREPGLESGLDLSGEEGREEFGVDVGEVGDPEAGDCGFDVESTFVFRVNPDLGIAFLRARFCMPSPQFGGSTF